ncbi:MAG: hypothetical protein ABWY57_17425 [Mycetocola sp.]
MLGSAQSGGRSSLKLLLVAYNRYLITLAWFEAAAVLDADPALSGAVRTPGAECCARAERRRLRPRRPLEEPSL